MPLKQYKAYTPGSQRTCRPLLLFEVRNRHNTKPTKPTLPTKPTIRPLLIHGLSVNEYRAVYNTVVEPFASTASTLSSYSHPQGINIKQRLWLTLDRPKLEEVVHKDGRVEVLETFISVFQPQTSSLRQQRAQVGTACVAVLPSHIHNMCVKQKLYFEILN